jgi:glyoxylase-like metal-dependent hydrolase (beta-lactamase superfamily II)
MSPWFPRWHLGGVVLLVETHQGPVLVDSGLGLHDYKNPSAIVRFFTADFGIHQNPELAAVNQITRFGFAPEDVRHIVQTHLHFDHAGGLPDFPCARVHIHRREVEAMRRPGGWIELGYDKHDFAHHPDWILYDQVTEKWHDFDAIRLPFDPEMYLIPLFGHTRGHCGVAVRDGEHWLFHCADALPTHVKFDILPDWIYRLVIGPHVPRLEAFARTHPEVRLTAGHMFMDFFTSNGTTS